MLKKSLIANYSSNTLLTIVSIICTPIYIKYLGVESYGLIAFYLILQNLLALLDMGMTPSVVREMACYKGGQRNISDVFTFLKTIEIVTLIISIFIALALYFSSDWIAGKWLNTNLYNKEFFKETLAIASIWVGMRFSESFYRAALIGLQEQVWLSKNTFLIQGFRHLMGVIFVTCISSSIDFFFFIQLLFSLLNVVVSRRKINSKFYLQINATQFSFKAISRIGKFGLATFGTKLLSTIITQLDKILLSTLLSLENFGIYMLAVTAVSILGSITNPMSQATYPQFIRLVEEKNNNSLVKLFHQTTQLVVFLCLPVIIIFIFFPEVFAFVWLGDKDSSVKFSLILPSLAIGSFLNALLSVSYQLQLANNQPKIFLISNAITVILLIPSYIFLIPILGIEGAGWMWAIVNLAYFLVIPHFVHSKILDQEKNIWYLKDVLTPVSISLVFGYLLKFLVNNLDDLSRRECLFFLIASSISVAFFIFLVQPILQETIKNSLIRKGILPSE